MDSDQKKYEAIQIPGRQQRQTRGEEKARPNATAGTSLPDGVFYEIDYDSRPIAGVGKFVLRSEPIQPPPKDEIRELFYRMREIGRQPGKTRFNYSRFFDWSVQRENARSFYKQAVFMKDFRDDYPEEVPFSSYFPTYQMMGYEQLRTYFTWRTKVRDGILEPTSLSYVFLYLYELLNNVGVDSPREGRDKLVAFWRDYQEFDAAVDRYVLKWLKDYHIYYDLPFEAFVEENGLAGYYPEVTGVEDSFGLFCAVSKYDIRKSIFYTEETKTLIKNCFDWVLQRVRQDLEKAQLDLEDVLFYPAGNMTAWTPFRNALFFPWFRQPDRKVILSERELYLCQDNKWVYSTTIVTEKGGRFAGFVLKRMEAVLRKVTKFKYKIGADLGMVDEETLELLQKAGVSLDRSIESAVLEFYREATKTVVTVDSASLARIRREALQTQEALTVEEEPPVVIAPVIAPPPAPLADGWESLKSALTQTESEALGILLRGEDIKAFADSRGVMLEVLADGINEKAADHIGDSLLDEALTVYEDYEEQIKGMIDL